MFVIIDGSGLMCTQYYGTLPEEVRYNQKSFGTPEAYEEALKNALPKSYYPDGSFEYTNGVQGYLQSLLSILYRFKPEHIAVCFDASRAKTFRREMSADYKAQRSKTPEPLSMQMRLAKKLTEELGIPMLEHERFEADDFAGTLAKRYACENEEVRLLTKDRDYFQLIDDHIHGWIMQPDKKIEELVDKYGECNSAPLGSYEYTPEIVESEIGVGPNLIVDWKALAGDPSDNIPGVKGVGDKAAIPLLKAYGSLMDIYDNVPDAGNIQAIEVVKRMWKQDFGIARPPVQALIDGKDSAFLSEQLATIKTDVPEELWIKGADGRTGLSRFETPDFSNGLGNFGKLELIGSSFGMDSLTEQTHDFNAGVDYIAWVEQKRAERENEKNAEERDDI